MVRVGGLRPVNRGLRQTPKVAQFTQQLGAAAVPGVTWQSGMTQRCALPFFLCAMELGNLNQYLFNFLIKEFDYIHKHFCYQPSEQLSGNSVWVRI